MLWHRPLYQVGGWGRGRIVNGCACSYWCSGVSSASPTPPGLLQADPTSFIRYGALDNKEEFKTDKEFMKMVGGTMGVALVVQAVSAGRY